MSGWERSRHIPWERIPQDGSNLEQQKEQIFRELQRETIEDELRLQERNLAMAEATTVGGDGQQQQQVALASDDGKKVGNKFFQTKIPYSNMEMLRQAAFGGTIGSITGAVFGFMDGMRTVGESSVLMNASNSAKGKYIFQGTSRSAAVFGGFFAGFHIVKYGIRIVADPGEVPEIVMAGAISMGALAYRPTLRASMPYAAMLIGMDGVQLMMRSYR